MGAGISQPAFRQDGEFYEVEGRRCIAIGGAYSIDKFHRQAGVSW